MPKFAAFLRGINLGGRRVTNDRFKECFAEMGFPGAQVFRASGNVVFEAESKASAAALTKRVEEGLEAALGYDVQTFLRSAAEVRAIAEFEPFDPKLLGASKGKLQVMLLTRKPSAKAAKDVLAMSSDDDCLALEGRELYWLPSGGTLETGLDFKAIEKLLGRATQRTKGTMEGIYKKYF
jgi:uncharacterized protein (DUF1697 family)